MKKYLTRVTELISRFEAVRVQHIPRSQNEHVDRLIRLASDDKYIVRSWLLVATQPDLAWRMNRAF